MMAIKNADGSGPGVLDGASLGIGGGSFINRRVNPFRYQGCLQLVR